MHDFTSPAGSVKRDNERYTYTAEELAAVLYDDGRNMYGCKPCPECGDPYRCVYNDAPGIIVCDGCGFRQAQRDDE